MKFIILLLLAPCVFANPLKAFKSHVGFLSSDELKGRGSGSEEIRQAANYIAIQFKALGLRPFNASGYEQVFSVEGQTSLERNVIAWLPAQIDTTNSLVFMAHYDGLGLDVSLPAEDQILNGARDNATGVAALIELARRFSHDHALRYNLVFVASAAEETGMHGSQFYLENPKFPISGLRVVLNLDGINVAGPRIDFFAMPNQGLSFSEDVIGLVEREGWLYLAPEWVDFMDTKFDSAPFLRAGVPAITLWAGNLGMDGSPAPALEMGEIHGPDDEINQHWDWTGVIDHIALYEALARYLMASKAKLRVTDRERFR
jgi:Zn-dependent M28 family amino/carboxypeptidase